MRARVGPRMGSLLVVWSSAAEEEEVEEEVFSRMRASRPCWIHDSSDEDEVIDEEDDVDSSASSCSDVDVVMGVCPLDGRGCGEKDRLGGTVRARQYNAADSFGELIIFIILCFEYLSCARSPRLSLS